MDAGFPITGHVRWHHMASTGRIKAAQLTCEIQVFSHKEVITQVGTTTKKIISIRKMFLRPMLYVHAPHHETHLKA